MYFSDPSNMSIDVIDTETLKFKRFLSGFVGVARTPAGTVDNNHSGPDGGPKHGRWLYAGDGNSPAKGFANNAEDPPFATLFVANGDGDTDHTRKIITIKIDPTILPPGFGLSMEQPSWEPQT